MTRARARHGGATRAAIYRAPTPKAPGAIGDTPLRSERRAGRAGRLAWMSHWWLMPILGAIVAVALCGALAHVIGFPLDDSWIHQDFARTLSTTGRFAYLPGRTGAGSTSPVWVLLLTPPYLLFRGEPPLWLVTAWPALLGCAALAGTGVVGGMTARELARRAGVSRRVADLASGVVALGMVAEWHLIWAAASGMETVLFALAVLGLIYAAGRGAHPALLGIVTAFAFSIRPEAAIAGTLVVGGSLWAAAGAVCARRPILLVALRRALREWALHWLVPFMASCLIGCIPYVVINIMASGHVLPSTFYAKSSYYATSNYLMAAGSDVAGLAVELVGSSPVVLLALALSYSHWLLSRGGKRASSIPNDVGGPGAKYDFPLKTVLWGWAAGLILIYLGRGVATILHARYLMPVLPELIALSGVGVASLVLDKRRQLLGVVSALLLLGAGIISAVRGAQIYGNNVRFINGTDVAAAFWLRDHATPGTLVATHDIGAIGYFSGHPVLDIAGLADPAVIPLQHDQAALEKYLRQRHAAYVAIYTDWFPSPDILVRDLKGREVYHAPASSDFVIYRTAW